MVDSLILYFKWLGFTKINKVDENKIGQSKILEEDIQIELENGILIIECKGIGGTSTDSDCNQISKIKYRRCKERAKFDVFALYIVNHQRYLPPINRKNPPFTENQIQDALNEERGLLTTWQLFKLYHSIINSALDKNKSRKDLLNFGVIDFRPENLIFIDEPKELFRNGEISVININNLKLVVSDEIYVEKNGEFQKAIITGLQLNGLSVNEVENGEVGLKLNLSIKNKSILWKKNPHYN